MYRLHLSKYMHKIDISGLFIIFEIPNILTSTFIICNLVIRKRTKIISLRFFDMLKMVQNLNLENTSNYLILNYINHYATSRLISIKTRIETSNGASAFPTVPASRLISTRTRIILDNHDNNDNSTTSSHPTTHNSQPLRNSFNNSSASANPNLAVQIRKSG